MHLLVGFLIFLVFWLLRYQSSRGKREIVILYPISRNIISGECSWVTFRFYYFILKADSLLLCLVLPWAFYRQNFLVVALVCATSRHYALEISTLAELATWELHRSLAWHFWDVIRGCLQTRSCFLLIQHLVDLGAHLIWLVHYLQKSGLVILRLLTTGKHFRRFIWELGLAFLLFNRLQCNNLKRAVHIWFGH